MDSSALTSLSPVDGRYAHVAKPLAALLSEAGLIRERIRIEALWILQLGKSAPAMLRDTLSPAVTARLQALAQSPDDDAPARVKAIEARINHDVKAVEYFVREAIAAAGASPATLELVHFGCTSEDINNLAYARLLLRARDEVLLPAIDAVLTDLDAVATRHADTAMLARTHGQPATPTTLGKEFANFVVRLRRLRKRFAHVVILGKWNGAVGNLNAHYAVAPQVDWLALSREFVAANGVAWNAHTTQIEPHDWVGEYCDACAALDVVALSLCRDVWGYISLGYLRQRAIAGEVGSSTMPHKVNPIDFENAEGIFGVANALLRHFTEKLPISRWQRDLTDSTVLRNVGVALAHSLIAWRSLTRGLAKIEADPARLAADLDEAWEVLGEAVQTALRAADVPNGYELLKDFSRGRAIDRAAYVEFVQTLPLPDEQRARLAALRPSGYLGVGAQLAKRRFD